MIGLGISPLDPGRHVPAIMQPEFRFSSRSEMGTHRAKLCSTRRDSTAQFLGDVVLETLQSQFLDRVLDFPVMPQ